MSELPTQTSAEAADQANDVARRLKADPVAADGLYVLDIIDVKVSPLATFIGVMIAALFVLVGWVPGYPDSADPVVLIVIKAALAVFILAALLALSCIAITDARRLLDAHSARDLDREIERILATAKSRWLRYNAAFALTISGVLLTAFTALFQI